MRASCRSGAPAGLPTGVVPGPRASLAQGQTTAASPAQVTVTRSSTERAATHRPDDKISLGRLRFWIHMQWDAALLRLQ